MSYGGLAGRVDAAPWYVIGCAAYGLVKADGGFLTRHERHVRAALDLLSAWELNGRGLVYVPMGGGWADEYVLHGYLLYEQMLYLLALEGAGRALGEEAWLGKARQLRQLLEINFRPASEPDPSLLYHPRAYQAALEGERPPYWLAGFHPGGYDLRFDGLGNALALLAGLGGPRDVEALTRHLEALALQLGSALVPAFHPPIEPGHPEWPALALNTALDFHNRPWEYHNGGLWPMVTGFMAAGLSGRGRSGLAIRQLDAIHRANGLAGWRFPEFLHGRTLEPMGVPHMLWSAAGGGACPPGGGGPGALRRHPDGMILHPFPASRLGEEDDVGAPGGKPAG